MDEDNVMKKAIINLKCSFTSNYWHFRKNRSKNCTTFFKCAI